MLKIVSMILLLIYLGYALFKGIKELRKETTKEIFLISIHVLSLSLVANCFLSSLSKLLVMLTMGGS